jgi:UDP-N-acetylmuramoyl-tripeptide--D-alanyl-D-alanine ligase
MKELGESSASEHAKIGQELASLGGIDAAYFFGGEMTHAAKSAQSGGVRAHAFDSKSELADRLRSDLQATDIILVKGSRSMKMEEVVRSLETGQPLTETKGH